MEKSILFKPTTDGSKRPLARNRILSARFTESEYVALESFAWSKGKTLADWVRDVILHSLEGASQPQMDMHIFTELVGSSDAFDEHARTVAARRQTCPGTAHRPLSPGPNHQGREGAGTPS